MFTGCRCAALTLAATKLNQVVAVVSGLLNKKNYELICYMHFIARF